MDLHYFPAFAVCDFGDSDLLFVNLHATTSFDHVPRGDVGADLVAFNLAKETNSKCIITLIPRNRLYGIDFNRIIAPKEMALETCKYFVEEDFAKMADFMKKYAFVAKDEEEYMYKKGIYESFWNMVKEMATGKSFVFFVHTQTSTIKNFPSVIDVTLFDDRMREAIKDVIERINEEFVSTLDSIEKEYLDYIKFSTKYHWGRIMKMVYGDFNPSLFEGVHKEYWMRMLKRVKLLNPDAYKLLKSKRGIESVTEIVDLCATKPRITLEMNFKGIRSYGTMEFLKNIKQLNTKLLGIQLECSSFLTELYPDLAVRIIKGLIDRITAND